MKEPNQFELTEEQQELFVYIWDRRYTLDTIGISAKMVFDWSKQGLLLDLVKPKARRKYSIVEFVWFKLIVGLREFGMSLEAIRNVRSMLLLSFTFVDILESIEDGSDQSLVDYLGEEKFVLIRDYIQKMKEDLSEDDFYAELDELNLPEYKYFNTVLSHLISDAILLRKEIVFNISSSGEVYVQVDGTSLDHNSELDHQAHIKLPLHLLISQFIQHEGMRTPEELVHFKFLTKKEMQILELLKNDNLVSLTVRMGQNQEIKLIESEESINVENASGKLTDYLMRNNYQEITCKTQNGKVTSMRRTTKHK